MLFLLAPRVMKKGVLKLYSAVFVKIHSNMHFCTQKHMFFKFLHNPFMKEMKPCDLSPSQNWVAHLARWIFMNLSLSRSSSCTERRENTLTYASRISFLNTRNLGYLASGNETKADFFSFWNIQSAPLPTHLKQHRSLSWWSYYNSFRATGFTLPGNTD